MKRAMLLWPLFAIATAMTVSVVACGGAKKVDQPAQGSSAPTASLAQLASAHRDFRGDLDDDEEPSEQRTEGQGNGDKDADFDDDALDARRGYLDRDDQTVLGFGQRASATEQRPIVSVVRRYRAAEQTADGEAACALLTATFVSAVPEDYGRGAGQKYARGKTCPEVISKLFVHFHRELVVPSTVTAVRVRGNKAVVLLGSALSRAGDFRLEREGGRWRIATLMGEWLP